MITAKYRSCCERGIKEAELAKAVAIQSAKDKKAFVQNILGRDPAEYLDERIDLRLRKGKGKGKGVGATAYLTHRGFQIPTETAEDIAFDPELDKETRMSMF